MSQMYRSTDPKQARHPLDPGPRNVVALYQVIDVSDNDSVIQTFRRRKLADDLAATFPTYQVREFSLVGGDNA